MVKVDTVYEDEFKRILRCSEGNRIWYQLWITDLDMNCIENTLKVIMKLRDGGYLIFKCGMFSFIERMVVRLGEY